MKGAIVFASLVTAMLLAPIAVYVFTFGHHLSNNHTLWAEMGSAMSGIYSPLLAVLALIVVLGQLRSQIEINKHQIDQAQIDQSRADIQYYLEQLDRSLDVRDPNGQTVRQMLCGIFQAAETDLLRSEKHLHFANLINNDYPRPFALWSAIYPLLAGFRAPGEYPYEHQVSAAVQKIIVMTDFPTCVALDNFHWTLTKGKASVDYEFSPLFCKRQGI